jgi:type I restriction enzyme S subunit
VTQAQFDFEQAWAGRVPARWRWTRNKELLADSQAVTADGSEELLSVSHLTGITPKSEKNVTMTAAENLDGYRLVDTDDLVINTMWAWMGALGVARQPGIVSPAYGVYSPRPDAPFNPVFYDYLYRSTPYVMEMTRLSRGIWSSRLRLYPDVFLRMAIPVPPPEEQRAIADYLDRETTRIDTLIEEQQRLIEMLRERRHSLIDGVFGGHVPNVRLQNACIDIVDCPHTTPEVSDDGEYEAVRTASVRNGKFRRGNGLPVDADTWKARNATGAPIVGDVLFTREAPAGEACMVPNDRICLGQRMVLLRIDHTACVGAFLLWQIYSDRVQDHFLLSANGSTVANVRLPVLRTTPIWLPDLTEQRRIAAYLDEQTAKIDNLVMETEQFIELSKERRSALITAAVTGQVDVREMA